MSPARFAVRITDWTRDEAALRAVRDPVFVAEQGVPAALEWDDADRAAVHAVAEDDTGRALGCARLLPTGQIGRVAVLREWRRRGVGDALMAALIEVARQRGDPRLMLHAQVKALPFYARLGFVVEGEPFDEAGIEHRTMKRELSRGERR